MINAEKLSFGFNSTSLFQDISFTLEENCHCALIGSNGTGKTTLTNLIREPDRFIFEGKLMLEGAGRIGYVSQFALREGDQSVTVFDYLCQDFLALEQAIGDVCLQMETADDMDALMEHYQNLLDESDAVDADNYEINIRRQLKLAELEGKESLELEKLSGGELKLVQVIRQMLRRPGLLIMDEPDVFLDFENLNGLRDLIKEPCWWLPTAGICWLTALTGSGIWKTEICRSLRVALQSIAIPACKRKSIFSWPPCPTRRKFAGLPKWWSESAKRPRK